MHPACIYSCLASLRKAIDRVSLRPALRLPDLKSVDDMPLPASASSSFCPLPRSATVVTSLRATSSGGKKKLLGRAGRGLAVVDPWGPNSIEPRAQTPPFSVALRGCSLPRPSCSLPAVFTLKSTRPPPSLSRSLARFLDRLVLVQLLLLRHRRLPLPAAMAPGSSSRLKQRRSAASQSLNLSLRFGWIVLVIWCEVRPPVPLPVDRSRPKSDRLTFTLSRADWRGASLESFTRRPGLHPAACCLLGRSPPVL